MILRWLPVPLVLSWTAVALPARADLTAARTRLAAVQLPLAAPSLRVRKQERILELRDGDRIVKTYPISLGYSPVGDKQRQGDYRTPEGDFYVCSRNERSAFHLFLGISYPDAEAASQGLAAGLIDRHQHAAILHSQKGRACPPWNTRLGGAVGLHGGGVGSDWTWGCVALSDEAIEELWIACPLGTPVVIQP